MDVNLLIKRDNIEYGCELINEKNTKRVPNYINECLNFHIQLRLTS